MFSKHLSDSLRHPRDVLSGLKQQKDVLIPRLMVVQPKKYMGGKNKINILLYMQTESTDKTVKS
jgi:hypothetical protein